MQIEKTRQTVRGQQVVYASRKAVTPAERRRGTVVLPSQGRRTWVAIRDANTNRVAVVPKGHVLDVVDAIFRGEWGPA